MDQDESGKRMMHAAQQRARLLRTQSYPHYLWHSLKESKAYRRIVLFWVNFRRYRLISRIITIVATFLTVMGTGALTVLFVLLFLLILPIVLLPISGTMLLGFFRREHQNRILRTFVSGHTVYLFFPEELRENSFSSATMHQLSRCSNSTVFVISPYTWSSRGVGGQGFYINARCEGDHLFVLRRHYFFFFRHLLTSLETQRIVVIL